MRNAEHLFTATHAKRNVLLAFLLILLVQVCASAQDENPARLQSSKTIKLNPLPLSHVRLTGGPLKAAQEADANLTAARGARATRQQHSLRSCVCAPDSSPKRRVTVDGMAPDET